MRFRPKSKLASHTNLDDWLRVIPMKNCEYFEGTNGNFVLQMPKSDNAVLQKLLAAISRKPFFKIKLDERGSFIWEKCDGKNSIGEICQLLENEFGDAVKPTANRTVLLFKKLYQYGLVRFFRENTPKGKEEVRSR